MGMHLKVGGSQICFLQNVAVNLEALVPGRLESFRGMIMTVAVTTVITTKIVTVTTIIYRMLIQDEAPAPSFISNVSLSSHNHPL